MRSRESIAIGAAVAALTVAAAPSFGRIDVTLSGVPGSSLVDVTISGNAAFAFPFAFNPNSFQLQDFAFDPFNSLFVGSPPPAFAITGTATNTTSGASIDVVSIQLDDDSDGSSDTLDDVLINFDGNLDFLVGESMLIDASGTIDLASIGATFDDLTVGFGLVGQNQVFAGGSLRIIPAPGVGALFGLAGIAAARRRRA